MMRMEDGLDWHGAHMGSREIMVGGRVTKRPHHQSWHCPVSSVDALNSAQGFPACSATSDDQDNVSAACTGGGGGWGSLMLNSKEHLRGNV